MTAQGSVHVERFGTGERVVLVHGGVMPASLIWSQQRPLAERWRLEVVDRRGYGRSPRRAGEDYEEDAQDILEVLGAEDAHLVGFSYGAVSALFAAAAEPRRIRSLTVVEPPLTAVAEDVPEVAAFRDRFLALLGDDPARAEDRQWVLELLERIGSRSLPVPDPMPSWLVEGARLIPRGRPPMERPDLGAIAGAGLPVLVVSGGHHAGYEAIADRLTDELRATRAVVPGMGHGVPLTGAPFNEVLERHLERAQELARTG